MKRILAIVLVLCLLCMNGYAEDEKSFRGMNDSALREYISDNLYDELVTKLDSTDYYVSDIQTVYISQEYIDNLEYNSRKNVYFGYTLAELDNAFQGKRYVFTLGDDGSTVVKEFEAYKDDTYNTVIRNVAIGTGVILVCVTVSAVTAGVGSAAAVHMIFAVAAKTAASCALSGAVMGGVSAGIVTGIQTGDMGQALEAAALAGSEGFKWGAITGAVSGGATEGIGLFKATTNGLTMNEAAIIQQQSKLPLSFIKNFHSMDEYNLYAEYGLEPININGMLAYGQDVDLDFVDEMGRTNRQRIEQGYSPIDSNGNSYELHHIGQQQDSPLAILTQDQHRGKGHFGTLHTNTGDSPSNIDRELFETEKDIFWNAYLMMFGGSV